MTFFWLKWCNNVGYRKVSAKTTRASWPPVPGRAGCSSKPKVWETCPTYPCVGPVFGVSKTIISGFVIESHLNLMNWHVPLESLKSQLPSFLPLVLPPLRVAFVTAWIAAILASHPRTCAERNTSSLRDAVLQAKLVIGDLGQPNRKFGIALASIDSWKTLACIWLRLKSRLLFIYFRCHLFLFYLLEAALLAIYMIQSPSFIWIHRGGLDGFWNLSLPTRTVWNTVQEVEAIGLECHDAGPGAVATEQSLEKSEPAAAAADPDMKVLVQQVLYTAVCGRPFSQYPNHIFDVETSCC